MTYALGRRVEHFDMPTVRAIVARRRHERQSDVVVHPRRGQERRVPDAARRSRVETTAEPRQSQGVTANGRRQKAKLMFITRKHISRRTMLQGMGVTMALPLLEAMVPARTALAKTAIGKMRLSAIEMVHGSAGARCPVWRRTSGRPRPRARRSTCRRAASRRSSRSGNTSPSSATPTCGTPRPSSCRRSAAITSVRAPCSSRRATRVRRRAPTCAPGSSLDQFYAQRHRTGHADSVDAAVHRAGRSGRRLLLRLLVRLHRQHQLVGPEHADADDSRSARRLRSAVRRGRHAR